MIHGDSVYDIIDKQDHQPVQAEMNRSPLGGAAVAAGVATPAAAAAADDRRLFLCRMNVSRNARRQMRFGDQKVKKQTNKQRNNNQNSETRTFVIYKDDLIESDSQSRHFMVPFKLNIAIEFVHFLSSIHLL